jgi:ATP-dependent Lon protease
MPVLPLRDVVLFPHVAMPLLVGRAGSLAAVEVASLSPTRELLLVTQRDGDVGAPGGSDLYRVGVVARLQQVSRLTGGTTKILVDGVRRVRAQRYTSSRQHQSLLEARVTNFPMREAAAGRSDDSWATVRHALTLFEEYAGLQRRLPAEIVGLLQGIDDPERLAYGMAAHLQVSIEHRQRLLESASLLDLAKGLIDILSEELELLQLEKRIDEQVRGSLFQNQREFFLQEQLRAIHKELGQDDGDDFEELVRQVAEKAMPEPVAARALREIRKLRRTSPMSPEAAVSRSWLEWMLGLPWSERTTDTTDLAHARAVLDADHYGLEDVKDRILDHIAVLARMGRLPGPILCLVGPPGVGKTSLGRSIASALGRKFVRMALGGIRDEAEIRGHRRTYIGALPGRIVQAMRRAETVNPVLLLDEVDKLGSDWRGDPASALLEVLDPEQHHAFNDHYLEVDYDLSQVLFITTANSLQSIPEALRDRMEIIRLPGYLEPEKIAIATKHLLPRQLAAHGIAREQVVLDDDVLPALIRGWTKEAGVRDLERRLARVSRKLTRRTVGPADAAADRKATKAGRKAVKGSASAKGGRKVAATARGGAKAGAVANAEFHVSRADLVELLGPAPHEDDDAGLRDQVGVASGLAYTSTGGELLEIEVSIVPGRGRLQLTGQLGDVIKESAAAALSYVRSRAAALGLERDFHRTRDIHVHLPAGATPKDGPSAGIAIATALTSALTGIPVRGNVAMTGEVTLRGRVLPIGGLREKGVAAHRYRLTDVIIPKGNLKDLGELPQEVRDGVTWHPVKTMDEVLLLALCDVPASSDELAQAAEEPAALVPARKAIRGRVPAGPLT